MCLVLDDVHVAEIRKYRMYKLILRTTHNITLVGKTFYDRDHGAKSSI
jgi:hypothetical protein